MIPRAATGRLRRFEADDDRPESRRRRWLLLLLGLAIWLPSACNALLGTETYADQIPDRGLLFADPTVDLVPGLLQTTVLEAAMLMPGDEVVADLELVNRSVVPVRFSFSTSAEEADPGLAQALQAVVRLADGACPPPAQASPGPGASPGAGPAGSVGTGAPAPVDPAELGPVLSSGSLAVAAFDGITPEMGPGEVDAASRTSLCVAVRLPIGADDRYQEAITRVRFTFDSAPVMRRVGG